MKKEKVTAKFVDTWVLGNLLASFLFSWLAFILESEPIIIFLIIYSLARVFEIIIYQINVLLFDAHRSGGEYKITSNTRIIVLLLHNFVEIIFWFATVYIALNNLEPFMPNATNFDILESSAVCFVSQDKSNLVGLDGFTSIISAIANLEVIAGLIMTLISLASFIGSPYNNTI